MDEKLLKKYDLIVGLEIHVEAKTASKMFCGCATESWQRKPNTQTCPVCLGLPGALPVANKKAVEQIIKIGLALNSQIDKQTKFDRKHYFYPDLPKGYQISQYDEPICYGGYLEITNEKGKPQKINIIRIHMEEEVAKSLHKNTEGGSEYTLLDYNKSGIPLFELVTEPVMSSGYQAWQFAKKYQQILRYLAVSDADIEKGQMRCEPNISVQERGTWKYEKGQIVPVGKSKLYPKVEIKNIASTKFIMKAVEYEFERLVELIEDGEEIHQETRGWNADKGITEFQRYKEAAEDYRYFPDPDIPPLSISQKLIDSLKREIPELPSQKIGRYTQNYKISTEDAEIIVDTQDKAIFFEKTAEKAMNNDQIAEIVKYLNGVCASWTNQNKKDISASKLNPESLYKVVALVEAGKISKNSATQIINELLNNGGDPAEIMQKAGVQQVSEASELEKWINEVIEENPSVVDDYLGGKENAFKFLMGKIMQKSKGSADPQKVSEILADKLKDLK